MKFIKKWYTYQKERFPVLIYGTYMLVVVLSVFFVTNYLKYQNDFSKDKLQWLLIIPMFAVAFLQFLMIRIVDEFKDYEEDCKYRPYRPVPRGLVSLKELGVIFVICAIIQVIVSIVYSNYIPLIAVWIFFFIMSKGYFIKKFISKHLLIEVALDEILMPLLIIYLIGFVDIKILQSSSLIYVFLVLAYLIAWIVEIARKIRCKEDEEEGVRTYTAVLGIKKATILLWMLETIVFGLQMFLIWSKNVYLPIIPYVLVSIINVLFIVKKNRKMAKLTELSANIYIMIVYLSMAILIV